MAAAATAGAVEAVPAPLERHAGGGGSNSNGDADLLPAGPPPALYQSLPLRLRAVNPPRARHRRAGQSAADSGGARGGVCPREGVRVAAATGDWRRRGPIAAALSFTCGGGGGAHLRRGPGPAAPAMLGRATSSRRSLVRAGAALHGPWPRSPHAAWVEVGRGEEPARDLRAGSQNPAGKAVVLFQEKPEWVSPYQSPNWPALRYY